MKAEKLEIEVELLKKRLTELEHPSPITRLTRFAVIGLVSAGALWAATTVPHIFKDGDTLTAAQLNENFQALAAKFEAMEGKTWRLIYETDVTSDTQSIVVSVDGNQDIEYSFKMRLKNGSVTNANTFLRLNGDTTAANYGYIYTANLNGTGTNPSPQTAASGLNFCYATATRMAICEGFLVAKTGFGRAMVAHQGSSILNTTVQEVTLNSSVWNNSASNITSIEFYSDQVTGIGAGSHIEIWARR